MQYLLWILQFHIIHKPLFHKILKMQAMKASLALQVSQFLQVWQTSLVL